MRRAMAEGSVIRSVSAPFTIVKCSITYRSIVIAARDVYRNSAVLVSRFNWMSRLPAALRELGPYAAIGLALPGGTLIVASLWAFRHRPWFAAHARRLLVIVLALGATIMIPGCTFLPGL
jgi:hypothetical protein